MKPQRESSSVSLSDAMSLLQEKGQDFIFTAFSQLTSCYKKASSVTDFQSMSLRDVSEEKLLNLGLRWTKKKDTDSGKDDEIDRSLP